MKESNRTMQEEKNEIEQKIIATHQMLSLTPDDHPRMPFLLAALGSFYEDRFDISDETEDINKAIENSCVAFTMTSDGFPKRLELLCLLGRTHSKRFERIGELEDNGKAIEYQSLAVALTSNGHPDMLTRLSNLGAYHNSRYQRLGELNDLEKAIECASGAVALTPDNYPDLPTCLANLGGSHGERYMRLGELEDLKKAIEYHSRAVALTPDGHPGLPSSLVNLGRSHNLRYQHMGELDGLEEASKCHTRAIALTSDGHSELPGRLASLGGSHGDRYQRLGELGDLQKAIEYESLAVELTPAGHLGLPRRLANLGVSHSNRYGRLGEVDDIEKTIDYLSRAVALTPDDHPNLSKYFANLGASCSDRYGRLGELKDLEKAIKYTSRAVSLTPNDHADLPMRLTNLGMSHDNRYMRLGELSDLEKAIECETRSVVLTSDNHPSLPNRLRNLGAAYNHQYERLGALGDLEKAIEYTSRAVKLTPDGHPELPSYFANLGVSHRARFQRLVTGELNDLEKAIEYQSRAVILTPDGHPYLPSRLMNLGVSHNDRFERLGKLNDLDRAIECNSRAFALLPVGHPTLTGLHLNHALFIFTRSKHSSNPSDLQVSLDCFRSASRTSTGSPRDKFNNALKWAKQSSLCGFLNPIEAYQTTINLLPQFVWLGATIYQRYQDLVTIETLAVDAACTAIRFSNYSLALEWLEQARCVVWNQTLMLRSPVDRLHALHPTLATQLQAVANQLHSTGSQSREVQVLASGPIVHGITAEQVAQEHRRLATEYDDLIAQARKLAGFEDLFRPMKATDLVRAARYGPVVVINCHEDRCDALLVIPGQDSVQHVPLPNFTAKDARSARLAIEKSIRSKGLRERGVKHKQGAVPKDSFEIVLEALWYNVAKPILDHLGYTVNSTNVPLPHITWCPTGALSFLPLHAAGDYDQPQSRVFDYVISSYTPTVTALLASTRSALSLDSKVLAVGLQFTPNHRPLPGTVRELEDVKDHVQKIAKFTQLVNDRATTTSVLDEMEKHDWVHLSCHAHQNVRSPTKSGFFLHDGTLDLASINRRSFKNKGLAFLSACQTATGDERLPDEAVHLGSGMLMAGYSSVIATMWSVVDDDAPLVAEKVYGELMKTRSLGNGEAGRALHTAVAALRDEVGEKAFERWVPYIHIGS